VSEPLTWGQLIERTERRHFVHFYGTDDEALARNVALYLAEGLQRGEGLLVVADAAHDEAFRRHLAEGSERVRRALLEGNEIHFLPAQQLLEQLSLAGEANAERFEVLLTAALQQARGAHPFRNVRVFGEIAGLLWSAGRHEPARRLEGFWNRLLLSQRFDLYCAYPIDVFSEAFQLGSIDGILCGHTHLVPTAVDGSLGDALERGMREVLGARLEGLQALIKENFRPAWAAVPKGEAVILWLRNNLPEAAPEILRRARGYYQDARALNGSALTSP
jgi:hypothetical protein